VCSRVPVFSLMATTYTARSLGRYLIIYPDVSVLILCQALPLRVSLIYHGLLISVTLSRIRRVYNVYHCLCKEGKCLSTPEVKVTFAG